MVRREGETLIVEGAVTFDTVPGLVEAANALLVQGVKAVDFAGVAEIDSAAVALALEWMRQARRVNVALRFVNLPDSMHNLAKLYGVSELLLPATA